jgi:hypothetical protein
VARDVEARGGGSCGCAVREWGSGESAAVRPCGSGYY